MNAWLGVVSAEHVRRAVDLGIAQIGHGKRAGLARMKAGDVLATIRRSSPLVIEIRCASSQLSV